ncbi:MAG: hypothetical protein ACRCSN_08785 [Dermatophilaceae bacterium]
MPVPETPTPEPAANPYDETFGAFAVVKKSGKGDAVIALPTNAAAGLVTMTHKGSSNFAVTVLDAANQQTADLLANEIGSYVGTAAFGLSGLGGEPAKLKVTADGSWTVAISPISSAKPLNATHRGKGATVLRYDGDAGDWKVAHQGSSNFAVNQVGGEFPNLAVNEIGSYSGTVPLSGGPSVVAITADGTWSLTRQ